MTDNKKRRGKYIYVVSLYPTVMYYDRYPTGHPVKICKPEQYDCNWFGLIYCKGLPPRGLYLPVLAKQNCRQCYDERNSVCRHTDAERAITGLWTTEEVKKALEKGHKITSIYEVTHFEQSSTDLWKSYIRKFLKIKLETSKFTCSEKEYRWKATKFDTEL